MSVSNPFPGLRTFEATESHLFFGREVPTDELLSKLRTNRFIAVVGTSGSGKSSLVRAGMLPDLYGGHMTIAGSRWRVAILRPGDAPIHALANALAAPAVLGSDGQPADMRTAITETVLRRGALGLVDVIRQARMETRENLLVVVDQFEELFRFKRSAASTQAEDESAAFVKLLLESTRQEEVPIYVVLTMRSEYLGDCTQFRGLPEAINAGQYLIPRMTRNQRREAITGPVAVGGATMAPRLIQRLLNDVGDNPDQLPILQHALMRTWDYWAAHHEKDEPIDIAHYEAIGGMTEALSRHADEALNELEADTQRNIAERVFKRLTEKGLDNREMRTPTKLGELCAITGAPQDAVVAVIEQFRRPGRSLLMPPASVPLDSDSLIDISHESLIRIWHRLRQWVDEEAQSARIYRRLAETAALYQADEAGLWRNPDLQIALQWHKRYIPTEPWAQQYHSGFASAMAFLNKSKRAARRRQILTILPIVLLPLALIGFAVQRVIIQKTHVLRSAMEEKREYQRQLQQTIEEVNVLESEKERDLEMALVATAEEVEALKVDKVKREILSEKIIESAVELSALGAEKKETQEVQQELTETVAELQALTVEKERKLVVKLAEIASELTDLNQSQGTTTGQDGPAPQAAITVTGSQSGSESVSEGLHPDQGASVEGHTTTELAALGTGSKGMPTDASVESIDTLQSLERSGALTITQRLNRWERLFEQASDDPGKTVARAKMAELTDIVSHSATIASEDRFVTSRDVVRLAPVGIASSFAPGKVYAFAWVRTPRDETLTLTWYDGDGKELGNMEFAIKRSVRRGFRTFSWKTFQKSGSYEARLHNHRGDLIGRRAFAIR
jgi:ABC-type dipeptide/oligopeptide/nickel transport system ATPase component